MLAPGKIILVQNVVSTAYSTKFKYVLIFTFTWSAIITDDAVNSEICG